MTAQKSHNQVLRHIVLLVQLKEVLDAIDYKRVTGCYFSIAKGDGRPWAYSCFLCSRRFLLPKIEYEDRDFGASPPTVMGSLDDDMGRLKRLLKGAYPILADLDRLGAVFTALGAVLTRD